MSVYRLEDEIVINASLDEVWDFFTDPRNLKRSPLKKWLSRTSMSPMLKKSIRECSWCIRYLLYWEFH